MITKTRAINITDKKTNIAYNILTILRLMTCILTVDKRKTGYNSTYNKLAVQWLNEALYFVSNFVVAESFVLRNRQLLLAANRYGTF